MSTPAQRTTSAAASAAAAARRPRARARCSPHLGAASPGHRGAGTLDRSRRCRRRRGSRRRRSDPAGARLGRADLAGRPRHRGGGCRRRRPGMAGQPASPHPGGSVQPRRVPAQDARPRQLRPLEQGTGRRPGQGLPRLERPGDDRLRRPARGSTGPGHQPRPRRHLPGHAPRPATRPDDPARGFCPAGEAHRPRARAAARPRRRRGDLRRRRHRRRLRDRADRRRRGDRVHRPLQGRRI